MKIHEQFERLIPYMDDNFIRYPLTEEGNFLPVLHIWQVVETAEAAGKLREIVDKFAVRYDIELEMQSRTTVDVSISPKTKYEESVQVPLSAEWSIEEMVEILVQIIKEV